MKCACDARAVGDVGVGRVRSGEPTSISAISASHGMWAMVDNPLEDVIYRGNLNADGRLRYGKKKIG